MQCPTCPDVALVMSERQGVEIDYCPTCRGVWLDRGELDKLIERSSSVPPARPAGASSDRPPAYLDSDYRDDRGRNSHRRKSWLGEIFD